MLSEFLSLADFPTLTCTQKIIIENFIGFDIQTSWVTLPASFFRPCYYDLSTDTVMKALE